MSHLWNLQTLFVYSASPFERFLPRACEIVSLVLLAIAVNWIRSRAKTLEVRERRFLGCLVTACGLLFVALSMVPSGIRLPTSARSVCVRTADKTEHCSAPSTSTLALAWLAELDIPDGAALCFRSPNKADRCLLPEHP